MKAVKVEKKHIYFFSFEYKSIVFVIWCVEFKRPEPPTDDQTKMPAKKQRRHLGEIIHDATKQNKFYLGNSELTRLWNLCPDNLQACRGEDRNFLPPIDSYLETPPDKSDPSYEWRALRLLARQSPLFFSLTPAPNNAAQNSTASNNVNPNKVPEYLENVRKKLNEMKSKHKPENENKMDTDNDLMMEKEDGLVEEDGELLKNDQIIGDDANVHKIITATDEQMRELCVIIGNEWEKLGAKLGKFIAHSTHFNSLWQMFSAIYFFVHHEYCLNGKTILYFCFRFSC